MAPDARRPLVLWVAGAPHAIDAIGDVLSGSDAVSLREIGPGWRGPADGDAVILCLDLDATALGGLRSALPRAVFVTSVDALTADPLSRAELRQFALEESTSHEVAAFAADGRDDGDAMAGLREVVDLMQRQAAVHAETVRLAREMAAIAATPSWVLARLAQGPRLRRVVAALRRSAGRRLPPPPDLSDRPLGVNVAGYIAAESGMGEAARSSIRALRRAGVPVALNNVEGPVRAMDPSFTDFQARNPYPVNLVHLNADNMETFARERGRRYFRGRYTIGYWFWELSRFREDWRPAFDHVHEVWVASHFVREALAAVATVPVTCLPPCVPLPEPLAVGRSYFSLPADRFIFLFTFDVSSQIERKNPMGLLRAFRRADLGDRAELVLKLTNADADPEGMRALHEAAAGLPVRFIEGYLSKAEVASLLRASDGYVSLHRAEGFGLTMAEAMLLDKPVVATGYSGNLEFMTDRDAWLVRHRLVSLQQDYGPYLRGSEWAAPDEAHAASLLREVALHPVAAATRARQGGERVRQLLGVEAAAERVLERLEAVRRGPRPSAVEGGRIGGEQVRP